MDSRRFPVYLLLDCSESMAGPAIEAVEQAVKTLVAELIKIPQSMETVHLSVITFSRVARQAVPLTELMGFQCPKLSVRPGTGLGAALGLLMNCFQHEVVKNTPDVKGDYRPLVFLLTDGQPTDQWMEAASQVRHLCQSGKLDIIAIGCGVDVDFTVLSSVADKVFAVHKLDLETIRKSFIWISASIKTASASLDRGVDDDRLKFSPPPPDTMEEAGPQTSFSDGRTMPRQLFIHALCTNRGGGIHREIRATRV